MKKINLNCGIYQIRNILTKFCYGGQSINLKTREKRHWSNLKNNKHDNSHLQNSYNKHGKDFFVFEILIYCLEKDLTKYEQLFCDIDKAHNLSYNIRECVDSNKGIKFSPKIRKKLSEAHKGKKLFPETIEKLSGKNSHMYGLKGKNHPAYGTKRSSETKKRMSKAQKGRKHSPETIKKMSKAAKNRKPISEETRRKMSGSKIGRYGGKNNPFYGKAHSPKTIEKIRRTKTTSKETILKILDLLEKNISIKTIVKKLNISMSTVYRTKNGCYDNLYNL